MRFPAEAAVFGKKGPPEWTRAAACRRAPPVVAPFWPRLPGPAWEPLRVLALDRFIQVGIVRHATVGVDTLADYEQFVQTYRQSSARSAA